jgi:hypothetical protein
MSLTAAQLKLCAALFAGATIGSVSTVAVQKQAKPKVSVQKRVGVAQSVERRSPKPKVVGSSPTPLAILDCPLPGISFSDSAPLAPFGGALVGGVALSPSNGADVALLPARQPHTFPPAVPEPDTWGLLILGFGCVGLSMRRKKSGFTQ